MTVAPVVLQTTSSPTVAPVEITTTKRTPPPSLCALPVNPQEDTADMNTVNGFRFGTRIIRFTVGIRISLSIILY